MGHNVHLPDRSAKALFQKAGAGSRKLPMRGNADLKGLAIASIAKYL